MMTRWRMAHSLALGLLCSICSAAEEAWYSVYLGGNKVGHSFSRESETADENRLVESETVMRIGLMDTPMSITIATRSVVDPSGRPKTLRYEMVSNGRSQVVNAVYGQQSIKVTVDNGGQTMQREIPIPAGAVLVDDVTGAIVRDGMVVKGATRTVHVLDPSTITLVVNKVTTRGQTTTDVRGVKATAQLIEIEDPRALTRIYLSNKGDVLKVEGALGLVMLPDSKEVALNMKGVGTTDLGQLNALIPEPALESNMVSRLTLEISGIDLSRLPNETGHWVRKHGSGWRVTIAPPNATRSGQQDAERQSASIAAVGRAEPLWTKPGLHIPSDQPRFKEIASEIVGGELNAYRAADKISRYVGGIMSTDASIGVLRNANEIMDTKVGVCRDYAILAATIMRAAGLPTRLVSGLIYEGDRFYYHAWVEVFTGARWMPFDPTRATRPFDATHLKLAHGNVEEGFTFTVLSGAKLSVREVIYTK